MTQSKAPIRIKGLVRLMNRVREQWQAGIAPHQAQQFREAVRQAITTVETACHQHGATPADLPAPSRRAYEYLKGLDLDALPQRQAAPSAPAAPPPPHRIYVNGVIAICDDYHDRFARKTAQASGQRWTDKTARPLAEEIAENARQIEQICEESGGTPGDLPTRSRRGYAWLAFLSDPQYLAIHLNTLATLQQTARARLRNATSFRIKLYHIPYLYRLKNSPDTLTMLISEGFIGAPQTITRALIRTVQQPEAQRSREQVKRYAADPTFEEIMLTLTTTTQQDQPLGQHHDLDAIFQRVNATYFQGTMARPQLRWTSIPTRRKMAHYHHYADTVAFSVTLDAPDIPHYVHDYIMYHELLHKHLGIEIANGRRRIHTPEFRALEREFRYYEKAQAFLDLYLQELVA